MLETREDWRYISLGLFHLKTQHRKMEIKVQGIFRHPDAGQHMVFLGDLLAILHRLGGGLEILANIVNDHWNVKKAYGLYRYLHEAFLGVSTLTSYICKKIFSPPAYTQMSLGPNCFGGCIMYCQCPNKIFWRT